MPRTRTEADRPFLAGRAPDRPHSTEDLEAVDLDDLLKLHWHPVVAYATRLLDSPDAGEDVAQEAFLRVWERKTQWRSRDPVSFLYRVARNLALNEQRRRRVRTRWIQRGEPAPLPAPTPLETAQERELQAAVERALRALAPRRREAFILARFHGLSYRQIAGVMGTSPQTVANQMSAALTDLRRALEPFCGESTPASPPDRLFSHRGSTTPMVETGNRGVSTADAPPARPRRLRNFAPTPFRPRG